MCFSPIGYDIVYDVVVFYDILSYIGVSKNGSKNRKIKIFFKLSNQKYFCYPGDMLITETVFLSKTDPPTIGNGLVEPGPHMGVAHFLRIF